MTGRRRLYPTLQITLYLYHKRSMLGVHTQIFNSNINTISTLINKIAPMQLHSEVKRNM